MIQRQFGVKSSLGRLVFALLSTAGAAFVLSSCAPDVKRISSPQSLRSYSLFAPRDGISGNWEHHVLRKGPTQYRIVETSNGSLLEARGRRSASLLLRVLAEPVPRRCRILSWTWRVDTLQASADITKKSFHDVGASLFVAFGDVGIFRDRRVPTLQYVWTNHNPSSADVVTGPYHEDTLRTIVVKHGRSGTLVKESRDIVQDYQRAFGKSPVSGVHAMAFFTDNDDTGEPVLAYYGPVELLCNHPPDA